MEKKLANIERQKKEENLRQLAQKARNTRIGLKETAPTEGRPPGYAMHVHVTMLVDYRIRCFPQSVPKWGIKINVTMMLKIDINLGVLPSVHVHTPRNVVHILCAL